MFFSSQNINNQNEYKKLLQILGYLSGLSSDSQNIPYLYYRMAENIFCKAFNATNLSRSDISIDAAKDDYGIGLKTFLYKNGNCLEKVAEFNKQRELFATYEGTDNSRLIHEVARLRNERINTTVDITNVNLDNLLYHCVTRAENEYRLYETKMDLINIENISDIVTNRGTIHFNDGVNEYSFNLSKSTLFKRFNINNTFNIEAPICENPFDILYNLYEQIPFTQSDIRIEKKPLDRVILPLYSLKASPKEVSERSGLNQWNARGRERDANEAYIAIPAWIHRKFPNFFPDRDVPFNLILPNASQSVLSAKVCQDGSKALMSNPNKDLGEWLLRTVLKLNEGQLLTYDILKNKGIDSVEITKNNDTEYSINFKNLGSYEEFELEFK